jgi:hypothetical protein
VASASFLSGRPLLSQSERSVVINLVISLCGRWHWARGYERADVTRANGESLFRVSVDAMIEQLADVIE